MIIITGAAGFVGSTLTRQLAGQGKNLRCLKRSADKIPPFLIPFGNQITWIDIDMKDYAALELAFDGAIQVYHCAAIVSYKESKREEVIKNNIKVTVNVVLMCKKLGAKLVHVSSVAAIGVAKKGEYITEEFELSVNKKHDGYTVSKLKSEVEVWKAIQEGLNAVIVNPSVIIGPSLGKKGSGAIFEALRKSSLFYTLGSVGFVDVEDVAKCMILLMNSEIASQRFILNADNISYKDLGTKVSQVFNKPAPKIPIMPLIPVMAWRCAAFWSYITGKPPAIDKATAKNVSIRYNYDNSKIRKAINYEFKPLDETITEICRTLKDQCA